MLYETLLSRLFGVLFLTCGPLFEPFFRYGFGRRYFTFGGRILLPLALAVLALVARATIPGYAHLPFAALELGLYNRAALPLRLAEPERAAFAGFAMLFLLAALLHYVWLLGQRLLRPDPT